MARNSGARPSRLLKLKKQFNEVIALDFDLACTSRLQIHDSDLEASRIEAMGMAQIERAFNPSRTKVQTEITPANFRDQGF